MENLDNSYDKAAYKAASLWAKNPHVELIYYSENHTYKVTSNKISTILRVSRVKYHTLSQIRSELEWIDAISKNTQLFVANPIASLLGNMLETVELDNGQKFVCCMFEYIHGVTPKFDNLLDSVPLFRELGYKTAILHNFCKTNCKISSLDRPEWNFETTISENAKWGSWKSFDGFNEQQIEILDRAKNIVEQNIAAYGCSAENFGLIHSDIRFANLIKTSKDVCIIDFDDCAFSWYMYDVACSLSFIEDDINVSKLAQAWIDGYTNHSSLDKKDIQIIPTFIMMRRLQLTGWLASHEDSDPVPEFKKGWIEGTIKVAQLYLENRLLNI